MRLLCSRSRSQQRFKMLLNVLDNVFWTTEHFVAKPGMVMQHHKPKCHAEKLIHCVQCQGHSEGLHNQNMTISVVFSKQLVGLQRNLVWQYSTISWSVLWKNRITAFKIKVTANVENVSVSDCVCPVFPEPLNHFCFFTKLGIVVYYNEAMCHVEKLVHNLQYQGYSKGLYNKKYYYFYYIFQTAGLFTTKLGCIIHKSVLWKNGITAFKVKVTAKVQNVSECLSCWYLLNHRIFCHQTWYGYAAS